MITKPFALVAPSTRGLSLAITRQLLLTTSLPVVATHRSDSADVARQHILAPLSDVDPSRLHLLHMELTSEPSIATAAQDLGRLISNDIKPYLQTAFFTGGVLHPERQPADFNVQHVNETFQTNIISHLHLIKHFVPFLPNRGTLTQPSTREPLSKWVHMSARVGSISDNHLGGWFSYRASKAALNQVIRTFNLYLQQKRLPVICVGMHPGTVKTDLSRDFWNGVPKEKLFQPDDAAEKLLGVLEGLTEEDGGKVWDWAGKEVRP